MKGDSAKNEQLLFCCCFGFECRTVEVLHSLWLTELVQTHWEWDHRPHYVFRVAR